MRDIWQETTFVHLSEFKQAGLDPVIGTWLHCDLGARDGSELAVNLRRIDE